MNFCEKPLCSKSIALLEKGNKFTIKQPFNQANFATEIFEFSRKMRFKYHFKNANENSNKSSLIESIISKTDPPISKNIDFENSMHKFEENAIKYGFQNQNINTQPKYIHQMKLPGDIVFCKADKGGCLIILNKKDYQTLVSKHLQDKETYKSLANCPDETIHVKLKSLILHYQPFLKKDEIKYLLQHEYQSSTFYILPKIHKSVIITNIIENKSSSYIDLRYMPADLESRPIVNNINSPTSRLSHFIDQILKPLVSLVPGYIKDSYDFLHKIPLFCQNGSILISLDVVNLYTNIPHELGLEAIEFWINKYPLNLKTHDIPFQFITEGVELILKNNTFIYNKNFFKQLKGTAMGTKIAPTYAHLTMAYLEVELFHKIKLLFGESILKKLTTKYFRFLDDIFVIWEPDFGNHEDFLNLICTMHPNIQLKYNVDPFKMPFLDVYLYIENNTIKSDIYYKTTDSRRYLHFHSNHPRHIKRNIPYVLAKRISRIVSDENMKNCRLNELKDILIDLKYPLKLINNAIDKSRNFHTDLIKTDEIIKNDNIIPFVFTYNSTSMGIVNNKILNHISYIYEQFFPDKEVNIIKSMKQPQNLLSMLRSSDLFKVERCNLPRCKTCPLIIIAKYFF